MITTDAVNKIAKLARLRFDDTQIVNFSTQLTNIMDMINQLSEVDCSDVEPLTSVCNMAQRLRKDEVTEKDISDQLFSNVSGSSAELANEIKCFIVPKVIE